MIDKVARFCYNKANKNIFFTYKPTNIIRVRTTLLEHKKEGGFRPPA